MEQFGKLWLTTIQDCGRSSGRSRIGTPLTVWRLYRADRLRSLFGAIEDWNSIFAFCLSMGEILRSLFGAIEDWNRTSGISTASLTSIAVALRGDRGLEHVGNKATVTMLPLRSLFGAIEDWNFIRPNLFRVQLIAVALRGDRGLEPRPAIVNKGVELIAVALRGDRGLELGCNQVASLVSAIAVALRGDRGLEPPRHLGLNNHPSNCGRSSGRSRIGTLWEVE